MSPVGGYAVGDGAAYSVDVWKARGFALRHASAIGVRLFQAEERLELDFPLGTLFGPCGGPRHATSSP